jgi:hypothetical protein
MRARLFLVTLLLLVSVEALACPIYAYERMLDWGPKLLASKIAIAAIVSVPRVDIVRMLFAYLPFVVLQWWLYRWGIWYGFSFDDSIVRSLWRAELFALDWGLLDAGLIVLLGCFRFFRWNKGRGVAWWQPVAYVVLLAVVGMAIG